MSKLLVLPPANKRAVAVAAVVGMRVGVLTVGRREVVDRREVVGRRVEVEDDMEVELVRSDVKSRVFKRASAERVGTGG